MAYLETHRPPKDFSVRGYVFYPTFQMENSITSREQTEFIVCSLLFLKKWKQKPLKVRFIYRGRILP